MFKSDVTNHSFYASKLTSNVAITEIILNPKTLIYLYHDKQHILFRFMTAFTTTTTTTTLSDYYEQESCHTRKDSHESKSQHSPSKHCHPWIPHWQDCCYKERLVTKFRHNNHWYWCQKGMNKTQVDLHQISLWHTCLQYTSSIQICLHTTCGTTFQSMTIVMDFGPWFMTHWATLRHHPCLSRAATSASSQVNPIFCKSLLTVLLQFTFGRPGPLLYPGTCQYSACCGMHWWSICRTCPSQRNCLSLSMLSMVRCQILVLTSMFVILSFQEMPSVLLCHLWCAVSSQCCCYQCQSQC